MIRFIPPSIIPLPLSSIVCISGGNDSIAVAHYLKHKYGINNLYHFNHGTAQSDEMEQNVVDFALEFGFISTFIRTANVLESEADFRNARFQYIKYGEDKTFITAHHLDDACESYLLNCFRGHPDYLPIPIVSNFGTNRVIHPFLLTDKQSLVEYVDRNNLRKYVVEDESNSVVKGSRRNFIRLKILPLLKDEKINLRPMIRRMYEKRLKQYEED